MSQIASWLPTAGNCDTYKAIHIRQHTKRRHTRGVATAHSVVVSLIPENRRVSKETYIYGKRDLYLWQKRPIPMAKESYGKTDLQTLTYLSVKRDLFIWQKRPINISIPERRVEVENEREKCVVLQVLPHPLFRV
jgi:hypothetical protein